MEDFFVKDTINILGIEFRVIKAISGNTSTTTKGIHTITAKVWHYYENGFTTAEIAEKLGITKSAIARHIREIVRKTGVFMSADSALIGYNTYKDKKDKTSKNLFSVYKKIYTKKAPELRKEILKSRKEKII